MLHEQVLLGSCALDAVLVDKAVEAGVTAEHFTDPDRQTIWKGFVALRIKGKQTDLLALSLELGAECPFSAFTECETAAPTSINFQEALGATLWARKTILLKKAGQSLLDSLRGKAEPARVLDHVTELQDIATAANDGNAADIDAVSVSVEQQFQDALDGKKDTRKRYPLPVAGWEKQLGPLFDNELVMVAARPSVGKTALMTQWTTELVRAGHKVAFIPTEVTAEDIVRQLSAQVARVNLQKLETEFPENLKKARDTAKRVRECKQLRIFDKSTDLSVIWSCCRMVKDWADVIIIDQLAQIRNPLGSRYESVTDTCSALVAIKKMFGKPLLVAHQLKRTEKDAVPDLADLKDSGAAEQDASRVLLLHFPPDNHMGMPQKGLQVDPPDTRDYFIVQAKHRFGVRDVSLKCKFHAPTTTFS